MLGLQNEQIEIPEPFVPSICVEISRIWSRELSGFSSELANKGTIELTFN